MRTSPCFYLTCLWRNALWLNAMHCGKKWWIREFVTPYIFPLNPDHVAARSLRSLRSNYKTTLNYKTPSGKKQTLKEAKYDTATYEKKNHFVVKRERTSPPAEWNQLWWRQLGGTGTQKLPYWNWISRVVNFAILTREYFAEFYFYDFNRQMWKKDNKIFDLTILNFILFFQRSEPLKTFR